MPVIRIIPSIPAKILLPIDFSPSSQAALLVAADLAKHFDADLHLVNVIPMFPASTLPDFVPEGEILQKGRAVAERHLAKCRAALTARDVRSTSSVEVGNDVAGNIMEVVEREQIDMVVISTHGMSGWHPIIFGSIAEKVIKLVKCPLLVLRSTRDDSAEKTPAGISTEWW